MSYPNINDPYFNEKITNKFKKYKIPKKKKSFHEICFPKTYELQLPQKLLGQYINPKTSYKGLLVFHKIGSGKTCTGINIAEKWKHKRKIIVLTPASLIGNFRNELRSKCASDEYLTDKERDKLRKLHPSSDEYMDIIDKSDERINKYYHIYSYHKFVDLVEHGEISLRNTIIIIDEVQNMVSDGGKFYQVLHDVIDNAPSELRVVLLSATPMFDRPSEIALTMNLLRLKEHIPTGPEFEKMFIRKVINKKTGKYEYYAQNLDKFKDMAKGYVSYFRGAPPFTFPETVIKYVKCEMSEFQYKSYLAVMKKETKNAEFTKMKEIRAFRAGQILDLPNNFFIGTRLISNVAFPNRNINEEGLESFKGKYLNIDNLESYSTKFFKILKKINKASGPVFVYSGFVEFGGLKTFKKVLRAHGYLDYIKYGEGRKRYAVMSGCESNDIKDEIKAVYNQSSNINGSKLKVLLISPSVKEGHSFKNVRQAHILEPYWNWSRMLQIIGRSSRYCSHKELDEEERQVKVYIYVAVHPNEKETVDQYIAKIATYKNRLISEFELALKECAIDCELNKNANVFKDMDEEDIKCDR